MAGTYYQLLQCVAPSAAEGAAQDFKPLAVSTTAEGVFRAVEAAQERNISADTLHVETFQMVAGLPSEYDPCLSSLAYEEWLDATTAAAA